jgi:tRNA threonylcarbamoyladenosine biosynthesis protein TsaE
MQKQFDLPNEMDSIKLAKRFADCLTVPAVLTFSGEIGTGKTTFIRALLQAIGIKNAIKSPTFSLVESYAYQQLQIHHFDLYRIDDETELEFIGFRDYFINSSICCIEWPERAPMMLAEVDLCFTLMIKENGRLIDINAKSVVGKTMLSYLVEKQ